MSRLKKQNKLENKLKHIFNDLEIPPSESLWNSIEQDLSNSKLEYNLRKHLNNASYTPTNKVWQNINNKLHIQSKPKRFVYWISGITLLAIGFLGGYFAFYQPKQILVTKTQLNTTVSAEPTTTNKNSIVAKQSKVPAIKEKESSISGSRKELIQPAQTSDQTIENKTENSIKNLANKPASNNAKTPKTNALLPQNQIKNPLRQSITKQNNNVINNAFNFNNLADSVAKTSLNNTLSDNKNPEKVLDKEIQNKPESKPNIFEIKDIPPINKNNLTDSSVTVSSAAADAYLKPEDELSKFGLTALLGLQATGMTLNMPSKDVYNLNKSYQLRKELEKTAVTWNGGFLLNYYANKNIILSTGLTINNIKQTLSYNLTTPNGSTDTNKIQPPYAYLHATDSVVIGTSRSLENTYSYTEIPIQITYMPGSNSKINAEFHAGVSYAFIGSVNTYMPDASCIGFMQIADRKQFPEFKHIWMAFGGVGTSYKINSGLFIGANLFGKTALNSMVGNNRWIQQTPYMVGINLFIRKHF
jgi:hypothetical protein